MSLPTDQDYIDEAYAEIETLRHHRLDARDAGTTRERDYGSTQHP